MNLRKITYLGRTCSGVDSKLNEEEWSECGLFFIDVSITRGPVEAIGSLIVFISHGPLFCWTDIRRDLSGQSVSLAAERNSDNLNAIMSAGVGYHRSVINIVLIIIQRDIEWLPLNYEFLP